MTKLERIILNFSVVRFLINKSKHIILPGFDGVPLYDVIVFFLSQVRRVGLNQRAEAVSFNFLMAIPAATIFLCTLIPYLPVSKQVTDELLVLTKDIFRSGDTYEFVSQFLKDFLMTPRSGLLSIGFVLAVYYASNSMMGIMYSFNKSLLSASKKNFLQMRWMAVKLTTVLILLIIATVILLITQGKLAQVLFDWLDIKNKFLIFLIFSVRWIVIGALFFYSVAITYKYAPAMHKRWRLSSPGAIFATFLLVVTNFAFSFWVNHFSTYNKVYGSIGTILIIMVLIYINSLLLLIGYELNVSIHSLKAMAEERQKAELQQQPAAEKKMVDNA
ncbi:MAG: YihY/virulence factor BrkB family protein [Chitinophagaceae bacterium]|nr:YihY/virulence factor BrkB family protein [Chitinophagaceae bacterium]